MLPRRILPFLLAACFLLACSPRSYVLSRVADAASSGGEVFARDDDPELVRDAVPFALKSMESLLESSPGHKGLLARIILGGPGAGDGRYEAGAGIVAADLMSLGVGNVEHIVFVEGHRRRPRQIDL